MGAIFLVLLKRSFDGVLGPLRATILKIGVPGESIFLGRASPLEGAQEAAKIWPPPNRLVRAMAQIFCQIRLNRVLDLS